MTAFRSYPQARYELPADGKVTGTYVLIHRGDGSGLVRTDGAHINDDNPAINYRGESWLVTLELRRDRDGRVTVDESLPCRGSREAVTRRQNWSTAPRSYAGAIIEAIRAHAESVWTDAHDVDGRDADARQRLHSLESDADKLATELRKVRAEIRRQSARLIGEE